MVAFVFALTFFSSTWRNFMILDFFPAFTILFYSRQKIAQLLSFILSYHLDYGRFLSGCAGLNQFEAGWGRLSWFVLSCASLCQFVSVCASLCQFVPVCARLHCGLYQIEMDWVINYVLEFNVHQLITSFAWNSILFQLVSSTHFWCNKGADERGQS